MQDDNYKYILVILNIHIKYRDIFSDHPAPFEIEFGHVCENPNEWEQRFERKDFDKNRYSGKVILIFL